MTLFQRSSGWRQDPETYADNLPLRLRRQTSQEEEEGEDINPDSDASLLQRHRDSDIEDDLLSNIVARPKSLQRLRAFMSRTPLLSVLSATRGKDSYATLSNDGATIVEDPPDLTQDDGNSFQTGQRRKGKRAASYKASIVSRDSHSALRESTSVSPSSQTPNPFRIGSTSADDVGASARDSGKFFEDHAPLSNNVVEVDEDASKWGDENPPDNSPSVKSHSVSQILRCTDFLLFIFPHRIFLCLRICSKMTRKGPDRCSKQREEIIHRPLALNQRDHAFHSKLFQTYMPTGVDYCWMFLWLLRIRKYALLFPLLIKLLYPSAVIVEQTKFYKQNPSISYQLLLTISTQVLGYGFAGLTRRYLVRPPSMIWPGTLMSTAMFTTMHKSENRTANGWKVTRWRFFSYVWTGAFLWYFLPGLLMPALSYFNVLTWLAPDNVVVANLFGVSSGLGLFPMTFDWAQIAYIGSPLLTPWWAAANVIGGLVIVMWLTAPALYYSNILYSSFMPILSAAVFDNTGKPYDVSRILTSDFLFDKEAYLKYSRVYLPITYVLAYTAQFAGLSALVTHTACWNGKNIWQQTKKSVTEKSQNGGYRPIRQSKQDSTWESPQSNVGASSSEEPETSAAMDGEDVHSRLMSRYDDAPQSWYLLLFIAMLTIGIFVVEYYPEVKLPWYGLLLALAITALLFIPVGIVMAITNQQSSLYLIDQLICGVVFPGRPVANMVFVTYCYISSAQDIKFSSDLKLGHYMKIPPKLLFAVQLVATLVSSVTQIGVLNWMFRHIDGICTQEAVNGFTCPIARVHFNGSILWGVVGPERFFGKDELYRHLIWAFLFGALAPVGIWLLGRRSKTNLWRKVNLPVLFSSLAWIPPATGLNFSVWALVCFIFNYLLRRRAFAWWGKYTMTMSAALDSGLAFAIVVVFFGIVYPGWMDGFRWWGTEVYKEGCDWRACSYKNIKPGEHFGPS